MKKFFAVLFVVVISAMLLIGCGKNNNSAGSSSTPAEKEYYTVTFVQEGNSDIVRSVESGTALTEIPQPAPVKGHTVRWDKTDFSSIKSNMTVNAIVTANVYVITFDYDNSGFEGVASSEVTYGERFTLPENKSEKFQFSGVKWVNKETNEVIEEGEYLFDKNIEVKFTYTEVYIEVINE